MADPGFPFGGGAPTLLWAPTCDTGAFQQKQMQKQKNWVLLERVGGGHNPVAPPDPPMFVPVIFSVYFLFLFFFLIILQKIVLIISY